MEYDAVVHKESVQQFLSTLYHALRASRRRIVLHCLANAEKDVLTTRELARRIASCEQSIPREAATGEPYRNAYNALSQTHLPTLAAAEIIVYDDERQTVMSVENFEISMLLMDTYALTVGAFYSLFRQSENKSQSIDDV
jgi:hypothetical protein